MNTIPAPAPIAGESVHGHTPSTPHVLRLLHPIRIRRGFVAGRLRTAGTPILAVCAYRPALRGVR